MTERPTAAAATCSRCGQPRKATCRICRKRFCANCWTDHHHEGYGTPATDER